MLINTAGDRAWLPTDYPGIDRCVFRLSPAGGRTSLLRMQAGARFPRHRHGGGEEVLVISGCVKLGDVLLRAGDFLFTDAGEEHDVAAIEDAVIYVSSDRATQLLEQPVEPAAEAQEAQFRRA